MFSRVNLKEFGDITKENERHEILIFNAIVNEKKIVFNGPFRETSNRFEVYFYLTFAEY